MQRASALSMLLLAVFACSSQGVSARTPFHNVYEIANPAEGPSDGSPLDRFGSAVSLVNDTLIVGAPEDSDVGEARRGAVYVFQRSGNAWVRQAKLSPSDPESRGFGHAVDLYPNLAVVGAYLEGDERRGVYVFARNGSTWSQEAYFEAPIEAADGAFGSSVAVSASLVLVGAPRATGETQRVFAYRRVAGVWMASEIITRNNEPSFGSSLDAAVPFAVIGSPASTSVPGQGGSAHAFEFSGGTWIERAAFTPTRLGNVGMIAEFGAAVSMVFDRVIVGAPGSVVSGRAAQGAAFVFVRNSQQQWIEASAPLFAANGQAQERLGAAVSAGSSRVLIGVPGKASPDGFANTGAMRAFVLSGNHWLDNGEMTPAAGVRGAAFGRSVALWTEVAVAGAPLQAVDVLPQIGAVQSFERDDLAGAWHADPLLKLPDGANLDRFGRTIAVDGDTALVASPTAELDDGRTHGIVHVFTRRSGKWARSTQLAIPLPNAHAGDRFGSALALRGDVAVIGAPEYDSPFAQDSGGAFVFRRNGADWLLETALVGDPHTGDQFGAAVAIDPHDANRIIVGAPRGDGAGSVVDCGAAYTYVRSGGQWTQQQRILAVDAENGDAFGTSVAMVGDWVAVGAPADNVGAPDQGSVYFYEQQSQAYVQRHRIDPGNGRGFDNFGEALVISEDARTLYVGAPGIDVGNLLHAGAVYKIGRPGAAWQMQAILPRDDVAALDRFGTALALAGSHLVVGAPFRAVSSMTNAGVAFLYSNGTSSQPLRIQPELPNFYGEFGRALAAWDDGASIPTTILVGHPGAIGPSPNFNWISGAVTVFDGAPLFNDQFE